MDALASQTVHAYGAAGPSLDDNGFHCIVPQP
jgi:hypothetical protein